MGPATRPSELTNNSSFKGLYAADTVIDIKLLRDFKGLANDFTDNEERTTLSPDSEEYQLRLVKPIHAHL